MMNVREARFEISQPDYRKCPDHDVPEYAFIGRSNVGKSSLINMLTGRKGLAKTSQTPGKTLLINHFSINNGQWYIVDLPGYGYAARNRAQREALEKLIHDYVLYRKQMTLLFVLIDIRHQPQKVDLEFLDWLGQNNIPFAIVFTKADKLGPVAAQTNIENYKKTLLETWESLPPIFLTSSQKTTGKQELLDYIETVNQQMEHNQQ